MDSESQFVSVPAPAVRPSARTQSGFIALDTVNVREVIAVRACVRKVPPAFFRGAYNDAWRHRISCGSQEGGSCLSCFREFCYSVLLAVAKCPRTSFLIVFTNLRTESGFISLD